MKQINVTAHFGSSATTDSYTLTVKSGTNGKLSTGNIILNGSNMKVNFSTTAIPDSGYYFINWTDSSSATSITSSTLNFDSEYVLADRSLIANFEKIVNVGYTIYYCLSNQEITDSDLSNLDTTKYPNKEIISVDNSTGKTPYELALEMTNAVKVIHIQVPAGKQVTSIKSTITSDEFIANVNKSIVGDNSTLYRLVFPNETADSFKIIIQNK